MMKKLFSLVICVMAVLFVGCEPNAPEVIGVFSVSETKQVTFSPGNLQYHPANNEWRFAQSQLDYIGEANSNCSSSYNGWLDLFGWSTSATHFGVSASDTIDDYLGDFVDWGTNKIDKDAPNTWRTLTNSEWEYVLLNRTNASSLCGIAQVDGVNGLILLPDSWTSPADVTFMAGFHRDLSVEAYSQYQTFTAAQWSKLEATGAVFLPAAGVRFGSVVDFKQSHSFCWSANTLNSAVACYLASGSRGAGMFSGYRYFGHSVRLVKDL